MKGSKLNVFKWVSILPLVATLIGEVVEALKGGRVDDDEVKRIGADLVAIVAAVVD